MIRDRCQVDPWFFITNFCYTTNDKGQVKKIPDWEFLHRTCNRWNQTHKTVMSLKAVQNMVTWLSASMNVWDVMFKANIQNGYFSIGETEAKKVKKRCQFIIDNLPEDIFGVAQVGDSKTEIEIDHGGGQFSRVYFMTSSPTAGRGETWHRCTFDEAAFNRNFEDLFNANKSRCVYLNIFSSPPKGRVGYFWWLDQHQVEMEIDFDKIYWWDNQDKKDDPEWEIRTRRGMSEDAFRREHCCEYISEGGRVYEAFGRETHVFHPDKFVLNPDWRFYRGIDWGWSHPFACCWLARWTCRDGSGAEWDRWYLFNEVYQTKTHLDKLARMLKEYDSRKRNFAHKDGAWDFTLTGKFEKQISDAESPRERNELAKLGIRTIPCKKGKDSVEAKIDLVGRALQIQPDGLPGLVVSEDCVNAIWEFENYMRSEVQGMGKGGTPIKENDHMMDAIGDVFLTVLGGESTDSGKPVSFTW